MKETYCLSRLPLWHQYLCWMQCFCNGGC